MPAPAVHHETPWYANTGVQSLMAFCAWMWLQYAWAVRPDYHLEGCILFTKYVVLCFILYKLLADLRAFEMFAWAHVFGCFLWGWVASGLDVGGRLELNFGPGVDDSNVVGFHIVTGMAFAGLMLMGLPGRRRWLTFGALPFMMNTLILTASRSALLGMLAAGISAFYLAPRRHRPMIAVCGILGIVLLVMLANETFWSRAETIRTTEEEEMDASAASRLVLLRAGFTMSGDYPFGAGHRGNEVLSRRYLPPELLNAQGVRSAHNTLIAVLVDQGWPGLVIYMGLYAWFALRLWKLKRLDKRGLPPMYGIYRAALGASFAAYVVSGLFINLLKAEVFLWLVALLAVLDRLAYEAIAAAPAPPNVRPDARAARQQSVPRLSHPTARVRVRSG